MNQIVLDTNFIISCAKNKVDFFEEIPLIGMQIIIPEQVLRELKQISESRKTKDRDSARLSINILNKSDYKKIDLENSYVDRGIVKFAKKNPDVIIATLDKELQRKIRNRKLIIRNRKTLEIQ